MVADHLSRGAAAETRAEAYLSVRGLVTIARNLRCRAGEIDLVCLDGEVLVFVEVRLRAAGRHGGALASVTPAKRRKLIRAVQFHWQRRPDWRPRTMRFDVIAVDGVDPCSGRITWIRDAFRADGC